MKGIVVITDSDLGGPGAEEEILANAGLELRRAAAVTEDETCAAAVGADALIVQWAPVTARVLDAAPTVRVVSRLGIGYDMIDVDAATERGVAVINAPDYCIDEVVAHALALILACTRGIVAYDRATRTGIWSARTTFPGATRPSMQTAAVIGLGRIGARVATALRALDYVVIGCDPVAAPPAGVQVADLDEALAQAQIVTLHAPLTAATRHLIDAAALARMRSDAWLVNTCRGPLVDETALAHALASGAISGAALDVFEQEPLPSTSPLTRLDNVILTPHAAWYSAASLAELPRIAATQVVDLLAGRRVINIINPEVMKIASHRRRVTWKI